MKKIILVLFLSLGFMSFKTKDNLKSENNSASFVEVEKISNEDYPCRWRVCLYNNGLLIGCSAWTYGECLDTVVIKTK